MELKVEITKARIEEWYETYNGECYISFSGGKDSTVLADLAAQVCEENCWKLVLWYCDTGLEYPEVKQHVKYFKEYLSEKYNIEVELILDYPKDRNGKRISFKDVIMKYGYPLISKEVSQKIFEARRTPHGAYAMRFEEDNPHALKYGKRYSMAKWKWLKDSDIPISHMCCNIMKKNPAKKFEKKSGKKPITGTMTHESNMRKTAWLQHGCNAFEAKRPISSPLSFWLEEDVLFYLQIYKIPYPSVYGDIVIGNDLKPHTTGCDRTGCVYCGFGCQCEAEPNRFQRLKQTHPQLWEYCMKPINENGLGMREALDYIGVKIE